MSSPPLDQQISPSREEGQGRTSQNQDLPWPNQLQWGHFDRTLPLQGTWWHPQAKVFVNVDFSKGYWCIEFHKASSFLNTINNPFNIFFFTRHLCRLTVAGDAFQQKLLAMTVGFSVTICSIYFSSSKVQVIFWWNFFCFVFFSRWYCFVLIELYSDAWNCPRGYLK